VRELKGSRIVIKKLVEIYMVAPKDKLHANLSDKSNVCVFVGYAVKSCR
jgi:hypothetical protein